MGHVPEAVREFDRTLPHFPDGRIDYRGAPAAAVMTCFVRYGDKLLLLKRSERVGTFQGLWSTMTGYTVAGAGPQPTCTCRAARLTV